MGGGSKSTYTRPQMISIINWNTFASHRFLRSNENLELQTIERSSIYFIIAHCQIKENVGVRNKKVAIICLRINRRYSPDRNYEMFSLILNHPGTFQ